MLLANVRVLDLSQYIPGPYITRMLADLGAQVIKVEPPAGDPMRHFGAESQDAVSNVYRALNQGKKIIRLNLKDDCEALVFKELLSKADVLIDGFRPAALDRLGFDRQTINRLNNTLIHCALSGFGQSGPLALKAGHDLGYCAVAGMLGSHNRKELPLISYPPLADHVGGLQACNSILAALYARTQTGQGCFIDASLYEPVLAWQYIAQSERISQILGGGAAYYNVYQTSDEKFITLSALEEKFWFAFCEAVGKPHWIVRHSDALPQIKLKSELDQFFNTHAFSQVSTLLTDVDCCFEPVSQMNNVYDHPQTVSRGVIHHYPNIIDGQTLSSKRELNEITEIENICWD